ncbi:MAG: PTS fructose transporter subunit IIA [Pseudomonadota bacterium]
MIGIVIVAHGGLAAEYKSAVEHVVGPQKSIGTVSIAATHDRADKQLEICRAADAVDEGDGVVLVIDMFGSSPSNLALRACQPKGRKILYGANLPMLVKLAKTRHKPLEDAVRAAREAGRKYIDSLDVQPEATH